MMRKVLLVGLVLVAAGLALAWPRINDVETGRTPEYPDLKTRDFSAGVPEVARMAQRAMEGLGWEVQGSGAGPRGAELRGVHTSPLVRLRETITVRVSTAGGRTRLSVRSQSTALPWDLGQNARNIRELLRALDRTP